MSDHEQQSENTGGYLLGALSEIEVHAFERHLKDCDKCRAEIDRLRLAVDALPRSVEQVQAPPGLRRALMREIEADLGPAADAPRRHARRRPSFSLPSFGRVAVPLAAVMLGVLLLVGGYELGRSGESGSDPANRSARTLSAEIDRERLPEASGSLRVAGGTDTPPLLRVQGMPVLKHDRVYQVWLRRGGEMVPAGVFTVRSDGSGVAPVTEELGDADGVAVTREPVGGAKAPSEVPVLSVNLDPTRSARPALTAGL